MNVASAVILAGGLGTRLRSAVPDLPKPMAPVGDRPFLEYQLDYWIAQGVSRFVLSVGYRHDVIVDHFGSSYKGAELDYAVEKEPLGTGGGLLFAAEKIDHGNPFLVLNGDTFFEVDLKVLNEFSLNNGADWCFSLFRTNEEGRYMGLDISPDGRINSLNSENISRLANGGVYWVHPNVLKNYKYKTGEIISLEKDIFPEGIASGQRFLGIEFTGTFIDIGVPDDYYRALSVLR